MRWLWRWLHMITLRRRQRGLGYLRITAGNNQTGVSGTTLPIPLQVQATDSGGHPAAGIVIEWDYQDNGSIDATGTTDTQGYASVSLPLISGVGARRAAARVRGQSLAVTFSVTVTSASASTLSAASVTSQSATVGSTVTDPPSVLVLDASGDPFAGQSVSFAITGGAGSIVPVGGVVMTDASGLAALTSWRMDVVAGTNTLTATATGLTGSPVTFTANGTAALPTQIAAAGGTGQTVTAGTIAAPLSWVIKDTLGNVVPSTTVAFNIKSQPIGGTASSLAPASAVSDASGLVSTVLTTATLAGAIEIQGFFADALGGLVIASITVTTVAGVVAQAVLTTQPSTNCASGAVLPGQPVVELRDVNGNVCTTASGTMTATITAGDGSLSGDTVSIVAGVATYTALTITDANGGTDLLHFSNGSVSVDAAVATTVAPPVPDRILSNVDPVAANAGVRMATSSVRVADTSNTNIPGYAGQVRVAIASGPGTLSGTTTVNCSNAVASFTDLAIDTAGSYTLAYTDPLGVLTPYTSPTFTISAAGADYPNKPAGLTTIGEFFCNKTNVEIGDYPVGAVSGVTGVMAVNGNTGSLLTTYGISDATAPYGTDQVRRIRYAASAFNGTGPANMALWNAATNTNFYTTQYLCYVWKFVGDGSGLFEFHASVTKQFWIASGTSGDASNYFCIPGNGSQTPRSQYKYEFRQQGAFSGQCNRPQNGAGSSYQHTVGHWYRTEILVAINNAANNSGGHAIYGGTNITLGDGTFKLYERDLTTGETSSTLIMDYSDICWKDAGTNNRNFKFHYWNGTYGGGPATKTQSDDIYIARMHIAGS